MTRQEYDAIITMLYQNLRKMKAYNGEEITVIDAKAIDAIRYFDVESFCGKIKVSEDYTLDDIATLLCDGFAMECGFSAVDYDKNDYYNAKETLRKLGYENPAFEEVQAEMLREGYPLILVEVDNYKRHKLTLKKLVDALDDAVEEKLKELNDGKVKSYCKPYAIDEFFIEADFFDYNAIFQKAIFGEVVYG